MTQKFKTRSISRYPDTFVSVKDFGAVGDGVTDDTAAIQAAIDAVDKGVLHFPEGNYRVASKIRINNKNDQNDGTARNFAIVGYGARLVSTVISAVAYELRSNKELAISGLQFSGEATGWVDVEGLWSSTLSDVTFGQTVKFSSLNTSSFDSHYWNAFNTCGFNRGIEFHTGTEGVDRTEFNGNNFYNCRIWYGTYAISVYGTAFMRANNFYGCDISYYDTAFLYVDQVISGGEINFYGGFFDSAGEIAGNDTKNLTVNFFGSAAMPNSYPLGNKLEYGSRQTIDAVSGGRAGGRLATSSINLMRGGNLAVWNGSTPVGPGVTGGGTATKQPGGLFGSYLNYQSGIANQYFECAAQPAPFSGTYSCTIIARRNSGSVSAASYIDGVVKLFGVMTFSGADVTVSTFNVSLTAGQVFSVRLFTDGGAGNFDVFYIGLSLGRQSQIASDCVSIYGSATYDPPSLVDGDGVTTTVTCANARPGMFAQASFTNNLQGIMVTAWVSANDTVSVRFQNETGGTINLASGTLTVKAGW